MGPSGFFYAQLCFRNIPDKPHEDDTIWMMVRFHII